MKRLHELHWQILFASVIGLVVGLFCNSLFTWDPTNQTWMKGIHFIGALFLRCLRFVAVPIVFFSLVGGIGTLSNLQKLGRIASRSIALYLCSTAIAISIGLGLSRLIEPGTGLDAQIQRQLQDTYTDTIQVKMQTAQAPDVWDTLLNIVPTNPFAALADGNMLQVIFFAVLLGLGIANLPTESRIKLVDVFEGLTQGTIQIVQGLMRFAPLAVFCLLWETGAQLGLDMIFLLGRYVLTVLLGLSCLAFGLYPLLLRLFTAMPLRRFFHAISPAQFLAFSSSSSSATMPVTLECCNDGLQLDRDVVQFVVPLGATINMDGTALYQGVAAVFIAQISGLSLSLMDQLTIVLTATLASIGTAGVPGVGLIMLVIVLESIGLSADQMAMGLAIIFGVDRLLDMARTVINVTGDCTVATVVDSLERTHSIKTDAP